jgi:carbon-monoxide dehydrogenase small subunit
MGNMTDKRTITVSVNGTKHTKEVPVRITLADFIRYELGLTGTHLGCEHGVCGACTILLDGRSARSCLMLAVQADGHELLTVEGIAPSPDKLHPLQEAFRDNHGLQCGFCTPGMLTTLLEFLRDNPDPTEHEVRVAISGNLCRCTGYQGIVLAALDAAKRMKAARACSWRPSLFDLHSRCCTDKYAALQPYARRFKACARRAMC